MIIDTEAKRNEFKSVKRIFFKEHVKICNRCYTGVDKKKRSVDLHHKVPLIEGGTNDFSNLIPLCGECHKEWHYIEGSMSFEDFMESPSYREYQALYIERENLQEILKDKSFMEGSKYLQEVIKKGRDVRKQLSLI